MQNRFMIKGIVIVVSATAFLGSIAFGQMKYRRPRSQQSPTPTPTPLPVIPPKESGVRSQPLRMAPTPSPSRQAFGQPQAPMQRPTPLPTPAKPGYTQVQRTNAAPVQAQKSPIPGQKVVAAPNQPRMLPTPAPVPQKPTPPPVPPPDIQAYLDRQVASSKDKKFHLIANGKDLPLTPFHVWRQKENGPNSTSTCVDMRSDEGRVYDIDFVTTGKDVTGVRVHRINGETVR